MGSQATDRHTCTYYDIQRMEIPYSREMVEAVWLSAGGSTRAALCALKDGAGYNVGGGFHHAFPDYGEGFCVIHDVAVAIRSLQRDRKIERALVVDCDVHQGNGTASIFGADETVFTVSIKENNYPSPSTAQQYRCEPCGRRRRRGVSGPSAERVDQALQAARTGSYDLMCYIGESRSVLPGQPW